LDMALFYESEFLKFTGAGWRSDLKQFLLSESHFSGYHLWSQILPIRSSSFSSEFFSSLLDRRANTLTTSNILRPFTAIVETDQTASPIGIRVQRVFLSSLDIFLRSSNRPFLRSGTVHLAIQFILRD
jgi:hypothetical protein